TLSGFNAFCLRHSATENSAESIAPFNHSTSLLDLQLFPKTTFQKLETSGSMSFNAIALTFPNFRSEIAAPAPPQNGSTNTSAFLPEATIASHINSVKRDFPPG